MPKACVKAVGSTRKSAPAVTGLYTHSTYTPLPQWTNDPITPLSIHNFCIQLYTPNLYKNTGVDEQFSPFSTGLIINTSHENKENRLVGNGG